MIEVELPDGRIIEVDALDAQSAARAAKAFLDRERENPPVVDPAATLPQFSPDPNTAELPAAPQPPSRASRLGRVFRDGAGAVADFAIGQVSPQPLAAGVQAAGVGLSEALDLPAAALNLVPAGIDFAFGTNLPRFPGLGTELREAATPLAGAAGVPLVDREELSTPQKAIFDATRFGAQAGVAVPALARAGAARGAELLAGGAPRAFDSVLRPFFGPQAGRTVAGDVAATGGAGVATAVADDTLVPSLEGSPVSQALVRGAAPLVGGVAGVTALTQAETAGRALGRAVGRPFGSNVDRAATDLALTPDERVAGRTFAPQEVDEAARIVRGAAADPDAALRRIGENRGALVALDPNAPIPSPAQLSEDPGLNRLQGRIDRRDATTQTAADVSNQRFAGSVRDSVDRIAPEGGDPSAVRARVQQEVDARTTAAQSEVDRAQTFADRTDAVRRSDADASGLPANPRDAKVESSQRLDSFLRNEVVDPLVAAKNERFNATPDVPVPTDRLVGAAERVRQNTEALPPNTRASATPAKALEDFESFAVRDEAGNVVGANETSFRTLGQLRAFISEQEAALRATPSPNPKALDNFRTLKESINKTVEGTPEAQEALTFFREKFAPVLGRDAGEAFNFRQDVKSGTANPSETAGRFIRKGAPELGDSLRRMLDAAPNPAEGERAARDFLLADLAASGVVDAKTGVLRPDRLRAWVRDRGNFDNIVPGFQRDLEATLARARKGEALAGKFADEVKAAQKNAKLTQDQIDKGALGLVARADPDRVVSSIMENTQRPAQLMDELLGVIGNDRQARDGLKVAVRDFLTKKATDTAPEKLPPGDRRGPVSRARLTNFLDTHKDVLPKVFSPEEMNTLRAGQKALDLAGYERLRVGSGSDTVEKAAPLFDALRDSPLGRGLEGVLRVKFGVLKVGGVLSGVRRALGGATTGVDRQAITDLIDRARFDPELMSLLLGRKIPVGSPRWNKEITRILAAGEFLRSGDEETDN